MYHVNRVELSYHFYTIDYSIIEVIIERERELEELVTADGV